MVYAILQGVKDVGWCSLQSDLNNARLPYGHGADAVY